MSILLIKIAQFRCYCSVSTSNAHGFRKQLPSSRLLCQKANRGVSIITVRTTATVLGKKKEVVKKQTRKHKDFRSIPGRNEAAALPTAVCFPHHPQREELSPFQDTESVLLYLAEAVKSHFSSNMFNTSTINW